MQVVRPLACIFVLFLITSASSASQPGPKLDDPANNPGFVYFYNNEFDSAVAYFDKEVGENPQDPDSFNHLAQAILYREMFRDGALESQLVSGNNPFLRRPNMKIGAQEKQHFMDCLNQSLKLSTAMLQGNPHDVPALYAAGVAHGLRANYLFLVEKAWIDSLREATAARKANQQILQIDTNFVDARFILGLNKYVVGCLPFYLRMLGSVGGFHGDKEGGIRELELVAQKGVLDRYDAQVLLAAIYRRERRPDKAIPLLENLARTFPRNYLFRFEQVQMYSDLGNKIAALQVLDEIDNLRQQKAPGYANLLEGKIEYLRGNLLVWYSDLHSALASVKEATQSAEELDLNTAVLAWLRLGQVNDLLGNHEQATHAYRETVKTAPESDAAAEAKSYISNPYRRKRISS